MKAILGCLLCLVFTTAETFAIKGGPAYGNGQVSTTGTYAGVLTPSALSPGANSIGIFSLTIPRSGLASGAIVLFTAGETYVGTVQGTADPDTAKMFAEIAASFNYVEIIPKGVNNGVVTYETVTVAATAAGQMNGQIRANPNAFSSASARIYGDANVQYSLTVNNPFTQIGYTISGFKQTQL